MRFLQNLTFFLRDSESTLFLSDSYKTPEMNELDIELSKKSKIIEIGSVEKKLRLFKVGGISGKSQNPQIVVNEIQVFLQKLSQKSIKIHRKILISRSPV